MANLKPQHGRTAPEVKLLGYSALSEARAFFAFTVAAGKTVGFPLSWLYRYEYCEDDDLETMRLYFGEHRVVVRGCPLRELQEHLHKGQGFHLRVTADRYQAMQQMEKSYIQSIEIDLIQQGEETSPEPKRTSSKSKHPSDHTVFGAS
jgi:hypothetical protein